MRITTELLDNAVATVHAFRGADVGSLTHGDLLDAQAAAAQARRAAELLLATFAAEVVRRSEFGGLARAEGYSSPQRLIAAVTGGSLADAHRLTEAGAVLVEPPPTADAGAAFAPDLPTCNTQSQDSVLANALRNGEIGVEAAALIRSTLARIRAAAER